MNTNIYSLTFQRADVQIRLPVNPTKISETKGTKNDEYNVLGLGPIIVPRIPKLKTLSLSSYFPGRPSSDVQLLDGFHMPEYYIKFFEGAMDDRAIIDYLPVRSYETGEPYGVDLVGFKCLVTQFSTEERGGETGDFYYDLSLTEYKDYSPIDLGPMQKAEDGTLVVSPVPTRSVPEGQLYAGAAAVANGPIYNSSYGDAPTKQLSGRRVVVSRIISDPARPYPIHVTTESGGALGWMKKEALQT